MRDRQHPGRTRDRIRLPLLRAARRRASSAAPAPAPGTRRVSRSERSGAGPGAAPVGAAARRHRRRRRPRSRGPAGPAPRRRRRDGHARYRARSRTRACGCRRTAGPTWCRRRRRCPIQPWARAVPPDRERNQLEPHTRCKPSGVGAPVPHAVRRRDRRAAEMPSASTSSTSADRTRIAPSTWIGRTHPRADAQFYGHSIGRWDGDTLIVDTVGFNEGFWMDRRGTPHTDTLHTVERFTRTDSRTIKYELTIDDPGRLHAALDERVQPGLGSGHGAVRVRVPAGQLRRQPDARLLEERGLDERNRSVASRLGTPDPADRRSALREIFSISQNRASARLRIENPCLRQSSAPHFDTYPFRVYDQLLLLRHL